MKFCINCKYIIPPAADYENAKCGHPKLARYNLVTGKSDPFCCSTERGSKTDGEFYPCGTDGALFEPKDAQ